MYNFFFIYNKTEASVDLCTILNSNFLSLSIINDPLPSKNPINQYLNRLSFNIYASRVVSEEPTL